MARAVRLVGLVSRSPQDRRLSRARGRDQKAGGEPKERREGTPRVREVVRQISGRYEVRSDRAVGADNRIDPRYAHTRS